MEKHDEYYRNPEHVEAFEHYKRTRDNPKPDAVGREFTKCHDALRRFPFESEQHRLAGYYRSGAEYATAAERERLKPWVEHSPACKKLMRRGRSCACGLTAIREGG